MELAQCHTDRSSNPTPAAGGDIGQLVLPPLVERASDLPQDENDGRDDDAHGPTRKLDRCVQAVGVAIQPCRQHGHNDHSRVGVDLESIALDPGSRLGSGHGLDPGFALGFGFGLGFGVSFGSNVGTDLNTAAVILLPLQECETFGNDCEGTGVSEVKSKDVAPTSMSGPRHRTAKVAPGVRAVSGSPCQGPGGFSITRPLPGPFRERGG